MTVAGPTDHGPAKAGHYGCHVVSLSGFQLTTAES
jgi:hypothetical protein